MSTILDKCASFEWRGPFISLSRVSNDSTEVIRRETDWSSIVGNKPVLDLRNGNLADLFPKPRSVFERGLKDFADRQQMSNTSSKFKSPSN